MIKKTQFIILYGLLLVAGLYINLHANITVPTNRPFSQFPLAVQEWKMLSQSEFSDGVLAVLKPADYISRTYGADKGQPVQLYIGYHSGGKDTGGIHSPKHCLPGSGWYEESSRRITLNVSGKKINVVEAVYQKGESRELFLYWFQVRNTSLTDEYSLKMAEIVGSVLYRRKDASFIRISLPVQGSIDETRTVGVRFVTDFYPIIKEYLPV